MAAHHWLVYRRRSLKRLGSARVVASADVSDAVQLERCLALLPVGVTYDVVDDLGGKQSGRTDKRNGWAEIARRIAGGGIAGVVAYDVSRLARNARLILNLKDALEKQGGVLRLGTMPDIDLTRPEVQFLLTSLAGAAQLQADLDSARMVGMMRQTFETGGHRGKDPMGYTSARDDKGTLIQPRSLVVVPEEAEVVRRVFALLACHPLVEVAAILNREGVPHRVPRPWTAAAIRDLWRRRDLYLGNVTSKRGLEVRPGRHEAILTDEVYRDVVVGVGRRRHSKGPKPRTAKRTYVLRGLVFCACGARMRGDTRVSRGSEWLYYQCPVADGKMAIVGPDGELVECHARRLPARTAEQAVLDAIRTFAVPEATMTAARAELARRLRQTPEATGSAARDKVRLTARLGKLADLYGWGHIDEARYRADRAEIEAGLAALSEDDRLVKFDRTRALVRTLPEAMAGASRDRLQELVAMVVERVEAADRQLGAIVWQPAARPFFATSTLGIWCPWRESNPRRRP